MNEMEPLDKERFGAFLLELRREKGWTQQELAERLFVSNKAVSKWERGQSLPDIALLTPLAEALGVSVAELLKGERLTEAQMDAGEVKELVSKTVQLSAEEAAQRQESRRRWQRIWVICAALAAAETVLVVLFGLLRGDAIVVYGLVEGMTLGFGAYFCFGAKDTLPSYYDENRISSYSDGVFRMNIPGVHFNNSNWPYILRAGKRWLLGTAVLWPVLFSLVRQVPGEWALWIAAMAACLSFFAPMVAAGKKYE